MKTFIPTILCGGAGSRLWPLSRELDPKPFIRLGDNQSFVQKAFLRGAAMPEVAAVLTVTNENFLFKVEDDFSEVNTTHLASHYVLEPFGRNTAAAVAAAALRAKALYGETAILLILAADHLIQNQAAFAQAVAQACELAAQGKLVTFGITPTAPETGYGYIQARGNEVVRFVEKPNKETAAQYLASGEYVWNSGMFCFTVGAVLAQMQALCPEVLQSVAACMAQSKLTEKPNASHLHLNKELFAQVPDDSFDYAVMEKTKAAAVVPCDIGWSDIGSWQALSETAQTDKAGNAAENTAAHFVNAKNTYVRSTSGRIVGAVGVEDLVIVDTPDALLVSHKAASQDVKNIYSALKAADNEAYKLHQTVHRWWGSYTILDEKPGFKVKRLEVKAKASLSLQLHHHRNEHWVVVEGVAEVINGEETITLKAGQSTYIPAMAKHRLTNLQDTPLAVIEVQTGAYLGEDDIVRFADLYGRV